MSLLNKLLGRPLSSAEHKKEELTVANGVPALGLDALASIGYGPEAALIILLPLGIIGLHYFPMIMLLVVATLLILYCSYQQTIAAYPNGGGAYIVASDNLGPRVGVWAAVALILDYLLNVAVGISAGVGVLVSAIPALQPYTLGLCLFILITLTFLNLRGVRESGLIFIIPTIAFILCLFITASIGFFDLWQSGGHPQPVTTPPAIPSATATVTVWLLLSAFANGLTAMTGVEAVTNGVPLFRKPSVIRAKWTLTIIVAVLALFLLVIGTLSPSYQIMAMDESQPGYRTILSQLVAAITGEGVFYYLASIAIIIVLTYSAQTSFADFPRVCRLLAQDNFLPHVFADRGRRLVYSHGIVVLAILSGVLLILFGGITDKLIPLFAIGAFSAFFLSQTGMVLHWRHKNVPRKSAKLLFNALGAITTGIALIIIVITKFTAGAWISIILIPLLVLLLISIKKHYAKIEKQLDHPLKLEDVKLQPPIVLIPIDDVNGMTEKAIYIGLRLSNDVTAVHIYTEKENSETLSESWKKNVIEPARKAHYATPHLEMIASPYRRIYQPLLKFIKKMQKEKPNRLIAIIIPELVEAYWYEQLLHNLHATVLRALIFLQRDRHTIIITTPWYLPRKKRK